jgi:hypothetical protein
LIADGRCVVLDGAIGTELMPVSGARPEVDEHLWGIGAVARDPASVRAVHRRYLEAGCDVISTNTWGLATALRGEHPRDLGTGARNATTSSSPASIGCRSIRSNRSRRTDRWYSSRVVDFSFFSFDDLFQQKAEQIARVEELSDAYHLKLGDDDVMVAYLIEVTRNDQGSENA